MRACLIAICLIFVFGIQNALANQRIYMGSGATSCGEWVSLKTNPAAFGYRKLWVLGYLSGLNKSNSIDFLEGHDADGIFVSIDNYCQQNPLKKVIDAANDVAYQMIRMK